jgi:rod shape-determining protein MreC
MDFFVRFKNQLFLIAMLLVQAIALAVQVPAPADASRPDGPKVRLLRLWATAMITPFEEGAHAVGWGVRTAWSDYVDLRSVRRQNKQLQQELTRMHIEQAAISEDALEFRRLQALLHFREKYVASTVVAQVVGTSGSEQSRVLTIDKGSRDGLKPDMPVITQDGVVGKLRDVFPTTSQVLEINDQSSGAGVILGSTRIRAILRGTTTGRVQISNLTADSRIKPGEVVLTSGGDQVYPRGLAVGTIENIAPDPDHQPYVAITVRPTVNLARVEEVLVITGTQPEMPQDSQQDLAAAAAQHAADLSAERLPSIHDDGPGIQPNGAAGANGATEAPVVIPRAVPALHPDRYSSGAMPPATEMTPGAAAAPRTTVSPPPRSPASPASNPAPPKPETPDSQTVPPQ